MKTRLAKWGATIVALWVAAAVQGCGDDDASSATDMGAPDLGPPADPDLGPPDEPDLGMEEPDAFDAGPALEMSETFGPCQEDWQCPGDGAVCRRGAAGWPEGFCTVPCVDRLGCDFLGTYHYCIEAEDGSGSFCERKCVNGVDCERPGYTCIAGNAEGNLICIGLCSAELSCGAGAECNPDSADCVAEGSLPADAARVGDPCEGDDACLSGRCIEARSGTSPTGWNGGYCHGFCILPQGYNTNSFFGPENRLPQGTCPDGNVCYPAAGSLTRGDLGVCFDGCETDDDCRRDEGYSCLKDFGTASGDVRSLEYGVCVPVDCGETECPAGYVCTRIRTTSGTRDVCEPG